ncbi:Do family serine endopeptidase [Uliginosibacterium sp. H1]|uniref:Do family serine endopeptidase n=1 Tax=Uliginosibacterium sp. H1 TaxID=3114757 RepID=UPI002E171171|nr:Do family serine endopeptidase [Uliginosibacterium sp. H1]
MQRLWLIFAQSVTVALALLFVVSTFKPEWLSRTDGKTPPQAAQLPFSITGAPTAPAIERTAAVPSYAEAARQALPSVVHVFTSKEVKAQRHPFQNDPLFRHFFGDRGGETQPERRASGLGSGVVVSQDGYILTNNHVVEAADEIEVAMHDGSKHLAKIVGRDPETDLAVLRIEAGKALPTVTFAENDNLKVGDVVLAIGNPFGVGQTVTMGIVSALGRSHLGINTFENFIQTDAAINPGNSGGALVDADGNLVGINSAIYSRSGGSLGIGFAIPVSLARNVLDQIVQTGGVTRGWIGVEVQEITPELAESFALPREGALIAGVMRGGPAAQAGIEPGDVLVSVDDRIITNPQRMLEAVAAQAPGRTVKVIVVRKGKQFESRLQVARRPNSSER